MARIIKLQPEYRQGKWDRQSHVVPKLILRGNWLSDAGFKPSKLVRVNCVDGMLMITAIEEP
jgi:hypothetical protein